MTCRTADEALAAGMADGAADPPLTEEQVIWIARLLGRDRTPAAAPAA